MTVAEAVKASTDFLARKDVPSPRVDAEHLVAHALGITRLDIYLQYDRPLTEEETVACRELVRRRGTREPLAYILGEWGFRRLTLKVDSRALIPRPETEVVVERCLGLLDGAETPLVLDVGTGTGAIALAIADERADATVTAIDVSEDALSLARENAERTGLADRVSFAHHDVREGLPRGPYDLVVSNPPYVEPNDLGTLQPEVRDWEPEQALVGQGVTEQITRAAHAVLRPGGALVLEVADGTALEVAALLAELGFAYVVPTPDLAGRDRVVEGRWTP
ncbi:MAG: peptide chain release factor N(5)-glutamine methyltransferase [Gaiellaceae bacterium]